jgi:dihydrolipoamide dehydrogenase
MSETNFDLVVIGGGPAGYTGAIRASQLGMKVACIEKRTTLGGTCLNVGCIPSKAMLDMSEKFEDANLHFKDIGINATKLELDILKMLERKNKIVGDLCKGIESLFAKHKIQKIIGSAKIINPTTIEVSGQKITTKNILISTGSEVSNLPGVVVDGKHIVSSTGALDFTSVPKHLVVIGGGYIGLELGSVWRRLGSKVTVVEYFDKIVPALDSEVGVAFTKILEKQGITFSLGTKVTKATVKDSNIELILTPAQGGGEVTITADKVLVSVGRKPFTEGLGLDELGITRDERGYITVDKNYRTKHPNIFAVGDVIIGPMLAHKAEEEAVAAVETIAGMHGHVNYNIIPSVVYTWPEVASVGITEEQAKTSGTPYKIGKFPFLANSRAKATGNTDGFVKILVDIKTDRIIGGHIIGPDAGTMIAELAVAMEFFASSEDIARTCHAHPTLSEAIKEACLAVEKRTINL